MILRLNRDEFGEPHIYKHGVTEQEVENILKYAVEDRPGTRNSRVAMGQTNGGRYLKVITFPTQFLARFFVLTAYNLEGKPLKAYKWRRRRRPQ